MSNENETMIQSGRLSTTEEPAGNSPTTLASNRMPQTGPDGEPITFNTHNVLYSFLGTKTIARAVFPWVGEDVLVQLAQAVVAAEQEDESDYFLFEQMVDIFGRPVKVLEFEDPDYEGQPSVYKVIDMGDKDHATAIWSDLDGCIYVCSEQTVYDREDRECGSAEVQPEEPAVGYVHEPGMPLPSDRSFSCTHANLGGMNEVDLTSPEKIKAALPWITRGQSRAISELLASNVDDTSNHVQMAVSILRGHRTEVLVFNNTAPEGGQTFVYMVDMGHPDHITLASTDPDFGFVYVTSRDQVLQHYSELGATQGVVPTAEGPVSTGRNLDSALGGWDGREAFDDLIQRGADLTEVTDLRTLQLLGLAASVNPQGLKEVLWPNVRGQTEQDFDQTMVQTIWAMQSLLTLLQQENAAPALRAQLTAVLDRLRHDMVVRPTVFTSPSVADVIDD